MTTTFPVIEFLAEELVARNWTFEDLLSRMPGDRDTNSLALELMTLRDKHILLGADLAKKLEEALGISAQFWLNLDEHWRTGRLPQASGANL